MKRASYGLGRTTIIMLSLSLLAPGILSSIGCGQSTALLSLNSFKLSGHSGLASDPGAAVPAPLPIPDSLSVLAGSSGMRRLSRDEFENTLKDLFGSSKSFAALNLQDDAYSPFDNDVAGQAASAPLIEGLENMATSVTTDLMADIPRRDQVIGCTPTEISDMVCLNRFIIKFGRRAFRRPLTAVEIGNFSALGQNYAAIDSNFYSGVAMVLQAFLQHPAFVYRLEIGSLAGDGSYVKLNDYEIATRLSYFLWGTTPDNALLDLAANHGLTTSVGRSNAALKMLADPKATARINRFHAMWFGFAKLSHTDALNQAMTNEITALLDKVIFQDNSSWLEVLRSPTTYIDSVMGQIYGLSVTGAPHWVNFPSDRQGVLSMGAFLSVAGKFGDTSPTQRGKFIRERLMCQPIPPSPPGVNTDNPPATLTLSNCKWDRYAAHRAPSSCAGCHSKMDPIGFGLENYDQNGKYRQYDLVNGVPDPACVIQGVGELTGVGTFQGPIQLSNVLIQSGALESCLVQQAYRFAVGHDVTAEQTFLGRLKESFETKGMHFKDLLVNMVASDEFTYRKGE